MKKLFLIASFLFLAGAMNGTMDALQFHGAWEKFKNTDFWNPETSWEKKWAEDAEGTMIPGNERFWGSSRWFVALTDGWHLVKFFWISFVALAILIALDVSRKNKFHLRLGWYEIAVFIGLFVAIRLIMSAGFYLTYTLIF